MCQLWKITRCKCQCLRVAAVAWTFVCAQIEPRCFTRMNGHMSAQGAPWTSDSNVKKAEQTNHNLTAREAARCFTGYTKDLTKLPRTASLPVSQFIITFWLGPRGQKGDIWATWQTSVSINEYKRSRKWCYGILKMAQHKHVLLTAENLSNLRLSSN